MKKKLRSSIFSLEFRELHNIRIFLMCFFILFSGYGQAFGQQKKNINLSMKDKTIQEVLWELKRQSGLTFVYNESDLANTNKITVHYTGTSIDEALTECLKGQNLVFIKQNNTMVIKKKDSTGSVQVTQIAPYMISGKVVDEKKRAIAGVTVVESGTTNVALTNSKGEFAIQIPGNANPVLAFTYIGMKRQSIACKPNTEYLNVVLVESDAQIEETVVTGYQTIDKHRMAGAYQTINAKDLYNDGTVSLEQSLQGRLSGVSVINTSGLVGVRQQMRVRGTSTLLGNQDPIWVVDGIIQEDPLPFSTKEINAQGEITSDNFDFIRNYVGSSISWLNVNDIKNITVLKDASSTAIYGVRAANGVIVIETKRGERGKPSFSYSYGLKMSEKVTYDKLELMNSKERVAVSREIYERGLTTNTPEYNSIGYTGALNKYLNKEISYEEFNAQVQELESVNTDWFDILFRNSLSSSHRLNLSGGGDNMNYTTSIGYSKNAGTAIGNNSDNYTGRINISTYTDKFQTSIGLSGSRSNTEGFYMVNPYSYATQTNRSIPAYNSDGDLFFYKTGIRNMLYNFINERNESLSENKLTSVNANVSLTYRPIRDLSIKLIGSYAISKTEGSSYATERTHYIANDYRWYDFGTAKPSDAAYKNSQLPVGGIYNQEATGGVSWTVRPSISYDKIFNKVHALTTMMGMEMSSMKNDGHKSTVFGYLHSRGKSFVSPPISYGNNTPNGIYKSFYNGITDLTNNNMGAYITTNYAYDRRYVINFSVRADASNRFGKSTNQNFSPVWAGGLRWNVASEKWFTSNDWLTDLGLSASYGYQRNMASNFSPDLIVKIPIGSNINITDANTGEYLLEISNLPYTDLSWEKTFTSNYSIDLSLFKNRVFLTFQSYAKKGRNMISPFDVPLEYGVSTMPVNGGDLNNRGFDWTVGFSPVRTKNFSWSVSVNASKNYNQVKKVGVMNPTWRTARSGSLFVDGYSLTSFWAFKFDGIDQETGYPKIDLTVDPNKDPLTDPTAYMVYAGKLTPDFTGGLSMTFRYKSLSLSSNFYLQLGGKQFLKPAFNEKNLPSEYSNMTSELVNRWVPGSTDAKIPGLPNKAILAISLPSGNNAALFAHEMYNYSTERVVSASSLKCNNLSLSYMIPERLARKISCKGINVSLSTQNLFSIVSKDFQGRDPEVAMGQQPRTRSFSFNINLSF